MKDNKLKNYYNKKSDYKISNNRLKNILDIIGCVSGKKILDIGCGQGELGKELKKRNNNVSGCDISIEAIEKAKEVLDRAFLFDVENDDFFSINQKYDIIIATEVIEHLFYPEKFISNLKKILNNKGEIVLTTPNFLVWSNRIKMLFGKFEYTESGFFERGHIHFFSYKSLKDLIKNSGNKIVAEKHIIHPKIPKIIGFKFPELFAYQIIIKII